MKFLTLNVDLNCPSLDLIASKWPAQEGIEDGYPLKSRYFITISCTRPVTSSGVKHYLAFIITVSNVNC